MNIENIILLAILIFALGVWLGVSLAKPYSYKGLRIPIQSSVPPIIKATIYKRRTEVK